MDRHPVTSAEQAPRYSSVLQMLCSQLVERRRYSLPLDVYSALTCPQGGKSALLTCLLNPLILNPCSFHNDTAPLCSEALCPLIPPIFAFVFNLDIYILIWERFFPGIGSPESGTPRRCNKMGQRQRLNILSLGALHGLTTEPWARSVQGLRERAGC